MTPLRSYAVTLGKDEKPVREDGLSLLRNIFSKKIREYLEGKMRNLEKKLYLCTQICQIVKL
jgi:hypothetical protein